MAVTDPIADLLTRIRNGAKAKKRAVDVPLSRLKRDIANILKKERYVSDVVEYEDNKQGILRVFLRYNKDDESVISGIERISRPGLRRYVNATEVPYTGRRKMGITIVSTSSGIMTNKQAGQRKIGGELLCRVW